MDFQVQIDALRQHAGALDQQSDAWRNAVADKVAQGDVTLTTDDLTTQGRDLQNAYSGVISQYGTYIARVNQALYQAANTLRQTANNYGDADAIIADRF